MCGIAAILRLGDRPLPGREVLGRMLAAIAHRGPDGGGAIFEEDIQLGAVRLAIVDLAGGRQPARGCDPELACVYNGELYEAPELRTALAPRGHALADRCDTTLLPHLYEEHGEAMVERLRGMFAFALWDGARKRLLLARDRLGLKPLYWARTREVLLVASEAKAIFASGLVTPRIDRDALDDAFSLSYPCPPRTMFEGVFELRPAHLLVVEARRQVPAPRRYWRAPFPPRGEHRRGRPADLARELRQVLADSVGRHLAAEVPVASNLSGGLDSSAITALAREARNGEALRTFSITFDDPRFDESAHARAVSAHLGGRADEVRADARAAELLPKLIWHLEAPQLVPGALGGLLLSARERREGVPVILTGDGADELFGGYDVFRAAKVRRALDRPWLAPLRGPLYSVIARATHQPRGLAERVANLARAEREIARAHGGIRPPWYDAWQLLDLDRDALLSPDGRRVRPSTEAPSGFGALVREDVAALDPLDAELALELETRLPSWILVISDRTSMAHGVEARVPFLDHRVVELVASLPPEAKLRGLREKAILRDAVADLLPRSIGRRRKQPFLMPTTDWFFGPSPPDFVREALDPVAVRDAGLFAPKIVAGLLTGLARTPTDHVDRLRHELVLSLVLGTQLLHRLFVSNSRTGSGPSEVAR